MSENVENLQRAIDAAGSGDRGTWLELADPDLEWIPVSDWPETDPIRGREAVWDFMVAANEPWEPGIYEIVEAIDEGDIVAAHLRRDLRGKSSGAEVEYDYWVVLAARDGKAIRIEFFDDRAAALEAAGLSK